MTKMPYKEGRREGPLPLELPSEMLEPLPLGQGFCFGCHQDVPCFTDCCRDLRLILTPYDVLRVKRALGMDSTEFLDAHTLTETDADWKVPVVRLRMEENEARTCPFVSKNGCRIYGDRPSSCRSYPLGRAARCSPQQFGDTAVEEQFFLVKEPHCLGFQENKEWTVEGWMRDQELLLYNEMNDLWMGFLSRYKPGSREEMGGKQWKMFFLACYSLDRFREFIFGTRFLSLFALPEETQEGMRKSDEELLRFAYTWLAFSLFKDPVLKMK